MNTIKETVAYLKDVISKRSEQVLLLEAALIDFNVMKVCSSRSAPSARLTATP
jgi:hypothetical protein